MTRDSVVVLVVGLVVVAGIAAAGVSVPERRAVPTSPTHQSQPTTAETPDGAAFPPGTSASGIDNATRLLEAHQSQLRTRTYSARLNATRATETTDENGTFVGFDVSRISVSVDKGANATRLTVADENATYDDANASVSYWVTEEAVATRNVDSGGSSTRITYSYLPNGTDEGPLLRRASGVWGDPSFALEPYLVAVDYEYSGTVTRDGRTLYRFASTGSNASAGGDDGLNSPNSIERVDAALLVDERGVVRSFDAGVVRSGGDETATTGAEYSVRNLGTAAPVAPDWVSTELPHVDATLSDDGTAVRIDHVGGATVSTAVLLLYSPSADANGELAEPFGPGDTLYLSLTRDDPGRIRASLNERPEASESFVRFEGENLSVVPWKIVVEGADLNRTTIEVRISDGAPNRTRPTPTVGPNGTRGAPLATVVRDSTTDVRNLGS